jgi:hypothetical protein
MQVVIFKENRIRKGKMMKIKNIIFRLEKFSMLNIADKTINSFNGKFGNVFKAVSKSSIC